MSKYLFKLLFILIISLYTPSLFAQGDDDSDIVTEVSEDYKDEKNRGHRMVPKHFACVISRTSGVAIENFNNVNISAYEILEAETEECIAFFTNERDFIYYLYSGISGEFIIRFQTGDVWLAGYIIIP